MTITPKQRERRKQGLGASDVAAVIGRDPWRSAYDLFIEKTGMAETEDDPGRFEIANALEPVILQLASKKLGLPVVKPTATFQLPEGMPGCGVVMANVDGMVEKFARGQPIVEAKSTCLEGEWGEEGSDQVPDRVLIQAQIQMICAGSQVAYVARLLSKFGFSFSMYRVPLNRDLAVELLRRADDFWTNHVQTGVPPEITPTNMPSLDLLAMVDREDRAVTIPDHVVESYVALNEACKAAEKAKDDAKAVLLAALGTAERGVGAGMQVRHGLVSTSRFDAKAFEAAHPDTFNLFKRESGYRTLRVTKAKENK